MAIAPALLLTEQITQLLSALYGDARGHAHFVIGRGSAATVKVLPAGRVEFVPPWILSELEYVVPDDICLPAATADQGGHRLLDLGAVWTEIPLEPVFDTYQGWVVPEDILGAAWARLDAFAVLPSIVIDNAWSLLAAWLLARPLALDMPEQLARAEKAQRRLGEALGGLTDEQQIIQPKGAGSMGPARYATMPAWHPAHPALRLPGSVNHDRGATGCVVTLAMLQIDRRYPIGDIEAALGQEEPTL